MKKYFSAIIVILSLLLNGILHLVSFDLFRDPMWYHIAVIVLLFFMQMLLFFLLYKHYHSISRIILTIFFVLASLYDVWFIFVDMRSQATHGIDILSVLSLLFDSACVVMMLLIKAKKEGYRGG